MTKTETPKLSARPYTAPRLIRPDTKGLSPEGKSRASPAEYTLVTNFGPS